MCRPNCGSLMLYSMTRMHTQVMSVMLTCIMKVVFANFYNSQQVVRAYGNILRVLATVSSISILLKVTAADDSEFEILFCNIWDLKIEHLQSDPRHAYGISTAIRIFPEVASQQYYWSTLQVWPLLALDPSFESQKKLQSLEYAVHPGNHPTARYI